MPSTASWSRRSCPRSPAATRSVLYPLALEQAPAGAFYYPANGGNSTGEVCQAIGRMPGFGERPGPMTLEEAAPSGTERAATGTMGSNSRVRAARARREPGWAPHRPSLLGDIERGSYAEAS